MNDTEQYWDNKRKEAAAKTGQQSLSTYFDGIKEAVRTSENKLLLYEQLKDFGIVGDPNDPLIRLDNLASTTRVDLTIKTTRMVNESLKQLEEAADPIQNELNPCWEILRDEYRKEPRDWDSRWQQAANAVMWDGVAKNTSRMIAKKDSPIWHELGTAFDDSIGNDYPPFFWNSGCGWEIVTAEEIEGLEFGG